MSGKIELLAPAGSEDALRAAVQCGADAVYLGLKNFGARANAANFTEEALENAVKYCHVRGVKVHLTLNTLIDDTSVKEFAKTVETAANAGVDAFILQDVGCARIAREVCPEIERHASTQMTAHSVDDVRWLVKNGYSRVVLSRELTFDEIKRIYSATGAELEVFAHGALCVCFSGQCLMSSFIGGRSGNRGECAQPCRKEYRAGARRGFFLSPRDLCLLDDLEKLKEAHVRSIKIEGRMKSGEYVAAVTKTYRKYLDDAKRAEKEDVEFLKKIFVRGDGFTRGFFGGENAPELMNYHQSNDNIVSRADKAALAAARESFESGAENKKIPVSLAFSAHGGEEIELKMSDGENRVFAAGGAPDCAQKRATTADDIKKQLSKLGSTPFFAENIDVSVDGGLFIPLGALNELRRSCTGELVKMRESIPKREIFPFEFLSEKREKTKDFVLTAQISRIGQLDAAKAADEVIIPLCLAEKIDLKDNYTIALPRISIDSEKLERRLEKFRGRRVLASTLGQIDIAKRLDMQIIGNFSLNAANSVSVDEFKKAGMGEIILSSEMSLARIRGVCEKSSIPCGAVVYGAMPLMVSRVCLIKGAAGKCEPRGVAISDATGAKFAIGCDGGEEHINTLFNSRVTYTADMMADIKRSGLSRALLLFGGEGAGEVREIIAQYKGEAAPRLPESYTRGYFKGK